MPKTKTLDLKKRVGGLSRHKMSIHFPAWTSSREPVVKWYFTGKYDNKGKKIMRGRIIKSGFGGLNIYGNKTNKRRRCIQTPT